MRHLEVLVVTEKTTSTKVLNWKVSTVKTVETAIETLQQRPFKVVAMSDNLSDIEKRKLQQVVNVLFEDVIVVTYNKVFGLAEAVKTAYWSKHKPGAERSYLDNSFEMTLANRITLN